MGASNAMAAYAKYAGLVPPLSLNLLVYMALVSKDSDNSPWYGQGYDSLARFALGRGRHAAISERDRRAVERALKPLHDVGAISTARRASVRQDGSNTARYRLHLDGVDAPRISGDVKPPEKPARPTDSVGREPVDNPGETALEIHNDPRNVAVTTHEMWRHDPRNVVPTTHENRGAEEPRGDKRSEKFEEEVVDLRTDVTVPGDPPPLQDPIFAHEVPVPPPPASGGGHGFCLTCHAVRKQAVLAVDPVNGSACALHLRDPDAEARVIPITRNRTA